MNIIADKSKAEYMQKRRTNKKTFSVLIDKDKIEKLEQRLNEIKKSKTAWLEEKIDEETKK